MPKIYSNSKRDEIRENLLNNALALIKQVGMKKLNIEELTKIVGIAKGTFYNFFDSKELLVYSIIEKQSNTYHHWIKVIFNEKGKLEHNDVKLFYKTLFFDKDNIYFYLTNDDIEQILAKFSTSLLERLQSEQAFAVQFLDLIPNKRKDYKLPAALNWIKIITFTIMNRKQLFEQPLESNINKMIDNLLDEIFETQN